MSIELPPLPNKLKLHTVMPNDYRYGHVYGYTADQMHAYARAAVNAALERAAQVCSHLDDWTGGHGMPASPGSSVYVAAIRALKSEGA